MGVGAYYLTTSYGHKGPLTVKGLTIIIIRGDNVFFTITILEIYFSPKCKLL
jgi:hypothetical protein